MSQLRVDLPEKLKPLLLPARIKIIEGGRGGAKSWSVASILTATAAFRPQRVLCAREIQRSLRESVHTLLKDRIEAMGLQSRLRALDTEIRGVHNNSLFMYAGLQAHTSMSIKSYEGADKTWVEEAQAVPKRSWEILMPTVSRKPGSEMWATANLDLEGDYFTQHFVRDPPSDAVVIHIGWEDNPWFTKELEAERANAKRVMTPDDYDHIWGGKPTGKVKGAIFGDQMQMLRKLGRIGMVTPRKGLPLNAFMDLGSSTGNATTVWMHQAYGTAHLFPAAYGREGQGLRHFWEWMEEFRKEHKLTWGKIFMPHDGRANMQGAELSNRIEIMEGLAKEADVPVEVVAVQRTPDLGAAIDVTREKMMDAWMDASNCSDGIQALEHYRYEWNEESQSFTRTPKHDWASNWADGFRQWAQGWWAERAPTESAQASHQPTYINGSY